MYYSSHFIATDRPTWIGIAAAHIPYKAAWEWVRGPSPLPFPNTNIYTTYLHVIIGAIL